jgi:hypothetical protein
MIDIFILLFILFILYIFNDISKFNNTLNLTENSIEDNIKNFFIRLNYKVYFFWGANENLNNLNQVIKESNLKEKYIIFFTNDYNDEINIPDNFIIYRTSLYKDKRKYNEYVFPALYCNNLSYSLQYEPLDPVIKTQKPKICFSGNYNTYYLREKWINELSESNLLECNFINTHTFRGGGMEQLLSYYKTSEFCFCPRGTGNWSIRFYETLYYGRIPIIIDTDILLPFENSIKWEKYIIIGKTIDEIIIKIINFWKNVDIIEAQKQSRKIYDTYFSQQNINNMILNEISYQGK